MENRTENETKSADFNPNISNNHVGLNGPYTLKVELRDGSELKSTVLAETPGNSQHLPGAPSHL